MPSDRDDSVNYTDEVLFGGDLVCRQSRKGYRFSVDAVLLAHFVTVNSGDRVLELGAGCGIISLVLAYRHPSITIDAIEIQPQLCDLARHNMSANGYGERCRVLSGDVRQISSHISAGTVDIVLANPPYQKRDHGRIGDCRERAVARHQLRGDLGSFVDAAAVALVDCGRAAFVYPAAQEDVLLGVLRVRGLYPCRLRSVYGYPGGRRKLVLVEAIKGKKVELLQEAPLYITAHVGGEYSPEIAAYYDQALQIT
ncbi:MAG: methyltransferase [Desulfobulbaceae bacterium]|nr:methyltransferase [Desulfobulbaceae bacterium]